ncbi:MAG: 30S ribosomal protein S9 [Candidatus Omnitrophica bacterium]|nr:30S ribosomal protein S9 [Candidatus Omnitrophota bacterium]MDD5080798.1 30S ribosomal protein S9 [Candidatus Omnitrophota bacterium]MDD5440915.1 30S ribosomal protein S9 [Candidatus Omnitrophota bacterium]
MSNQSLKSVYIATGRRKEAIARVRVKPNGKGKITVNGRDYDKYFCTIDQQMQIIKPFNVLEQQDQKFDVTINVSGGGNSGQAGAVCLGISRCLVEMDPALRPVLRKEDLLTRDPRVRERKKFGHKGARKSFQWTKR